MALIEFKNLPDTTTPITAENLNYNFNEIFNLIYPIGSIYMNVNNINPSIIFGGKWVKIEDRFLLGASSTYTAGSTGGQDRASVAIEMFRGGDGNKRIYYDFARQDFTSDYIANVRYMTEGNYSEYGETSEYQKYGIKVANLNDGDKLMPPYLSVYIWKRTE